MPHDMEPLSSQLNDDSDSDAQGESQSTQNSSPPESQEVGKPSSQESLQNTPSSSLPGSQEIQEPNNSMVGYYAGLTREGNEPKLLATSIKKKWSRPSKTTSDGRTVLAPKLSSLVTGHGIVQQLKTGLEEKIIAIVAGMRPLAWISINFLRLGYEEEEELNPVIILVTVEEGKIQPTQAATIVTKLKDLCVKNQLSNVEAELMEGCRAESISNREQKAKTLLTDTAEYKPKREVEKLPTPVIHPLVGSSIGYDDDKAGTGTLGGYVSVNGQVYGLTNHHVLFEDLRKDSFPSDREKETNIKRAVVQPSRANLADRVSELQAKKTKSKGKSSDKAHKTPTYTRKLRACLATTI